MTNSELLNTLVTKMAEQKGYAYTAGYLQSTIMTIASGMTRKQALEFNSDLQYTLNKLTQGAL